MIAPVLVALVCVLIYWYFQKNFTYWEKRNVPGPKPVWLFGNIKPNARRQEVINTLVKRIYDAYPDEKVVGMYRMTAPCLLLRDPEVIKNVFIKAFNNFDTRGVSQTSDQLGSNIFHSDGTYWRALRTQFSPLFSSGKLKALIPLMDEQATKSLTKLKKNLQQTNDDINVSMLFKKYTISTFCATGLALNIDLDDPATSDTIFHIDQIATNNNFAFELDMIFPGILRQLKLSLFPKVMTNFFTSVVTTAVKQRTGMEAKNKIFIDTILEMKKEGVSKNTDNVVELTDDVITAQVFVFFLAGYETSAQTICYMLYELSKYKDIQDKVVKEIEEVLEKHEGKITYESIKEMTYMDQVIDETLRLYPILDPVVRFANEDYKIPDTDVTLEKGKVALISISGLHYDEKYFPDPLKFDPERFSPENAKNIDPCVYMPFGIGPRICIGARYARMQIKTCIAKFLPEYHFDLSEAIIKNPLQYAGDKIVLTPKTGVTLKLTPRKTVK